MSYAAAQTDRMLAGLVIPCYVVAVDLVAARVRVTDGGDWTSAWVRWHAIAAGKARHWRAPSLSEQGVLVSPSGEPAQGTFVPGLYGNAGHCQAQVVVSREMHRAIPVGAGRGRSVVRHHIRVAF